MTNSSFYFENHIDSTLFKLKLNIYIYVKVLVCTVLAPLCSFKYRKRIFRKDGDVQKVWMIRNVKSFFFAVILKASIVLLSSFCII